MKRIASAVALGSAALIATQATAATLTSQASADFRNVQLSVIDLTPNDGVAAGYTVKQLGGNDNLDVWGGTHYATDDLQEHRITDLSAFDFTAAQAQLQGNIKGAGGIGDLHSAISYTSAAGNAAAFASINNRYEFTVQPHTSLTLSGQLLLSLTQSGPRAYSWGRSSGLFDASFWQDGTHTCYNSVTLTFNSSLTAPGTHAPISFNCTFTNDSNSAVTTDLYLSLETAVVNADPGAPQPVPEPGSWLMLGSGLALLGAVARRRRG